MKIEMHSIINTDSLQRSPLKCNDKSQKADKKALQPKALHICCSGVRASVGMRAEGLVREAWWNEPGLNKQHGYGELWDSHQVC